MISLGREKIAEAARELADHLQSIENIRALQIGQKELSDQIAKLNDRISSVEIEIRALKAETVLASIKETQSLVNAVQGGLNQRIEHLAVKVGVLTARLAEPGHTFDATSENSVTSDAFKPVAAITNK